MLDNFFPNIKIKRNEKCAGTIKVLFKFKMVMMQWLVTTVEPRQLYVSWHQKI